MDSHVSPRAQTQSPLCGDGASPSMAAWNEAILRTWGSLPCKDTDAAVQAPQQAATPYHSPSPSLCEDSAALQSRRPTGPNPKASGESERLTREAELFSPALLGGAPGSHRKELEEWKRRHTPTQRSHGSQMGTRKSMQGLSGAAAVAGSWGQRSHVHRTQGPRQMWVH